MDWWSDLLEGPGCLFHVLFLIGIAAGVVYLDMLIVRLLF